MVGDFVKGARFFLAGLKNVMRSETRKFVMIPLLINVAIFAGLFWLGFDLVDSALTQLIPESWGWVAYIIWPIAIIAALVICFYTFTLLANLIGSPFNERLSQVVAEIDGLPFPDVPDTGLLTGVGNAMAGEVRKWLYFLSFLLPIGVVWLVPIVNILAAPLWIVAGAWMLGFEYSDYPMSNSGYKFADKRGWARQNKAKVLGFGFACLGATMIPILNFFVMPSAVIGASLLWNDARREGLA